MGALVVGRQPKHRDRSIMFPLCFTFFFLCMAIYISLEPRDSYSPSPHVRRGLGLGFTFQEICSRVLPTLKHSLTDFFFDNPEISHLRGSFP